MKIALYVLLFICVAYLLGLWWVGLTLVPAVTFFWKKTLKAVESKDVPPDVVDDYLNKRGFILIGTIREVLA